MQLIAPPVLFQPLLTWIEDSLHHLHDSLYALESKAKLPLTEKHPALLYIHIAETGDLILCSGLPPLFLSTLDIKRCVVYHYFTLVCRIQTILMIVSL